MSGDHWAILIGSISGGFATVVASIIAAYNSIRANKQSGATHDIVKGNGDADKKG